MSANDAVRRRLARVPLFNDCDRHQLDQIASLMTELRIPAGEILVRQGFGTAQFFVIQDGRASVSRDGQEIAQIGPGDVVGEISMIDGGARTATVTALTDMTVDVSTHGEFSGLLDKAPQIAVRLLPTLARRIREARSEPDWSRPIPAKDDH